MRQLAVGIYLLALSACGDSNAPQFVFQGNWQLTAINGQALPQQVIDDQVVIEAGSLRSFPPTSSWRWCEAGEHGPRLRVERVGFLDTDAEDRRAEVFYSDWLAYTPDPVRVEGDVLTWEFGGGSGPAGGIDVLTFKRLPDAADPEPPPCH